MAVGKRERQKRITELVEEEVIETQEELSERLRAEGYEVTQATVSRDIAQLRLNKVPTPDGKQRYTSTVRGEDSHLSAKYARVFKDGFMSMDNAQNILVIKTVSGMAMAVAASIDAMNMKEVVGSIAGDDTIMVAIRTTEETKIVMDKLREIL
ncbi:MAG: arginine repressor [Lachnospiraceae bacterium]|jgi:transcriptional regulator of arginine metabolism|nr:arginine repressor [Lachnospiraceae bacterium]